MINIQKNTEPGYEDEELWDSRELGATEEHAKRASPELEKQIHDSLNLQAISIRLPVDVLEQLKILAHNDGIGYQPFIRQIVTRFAREHTKQFRSVG